jgi:TRAP-type mannitol/chloroaromatic compound transport system permease small subunit
MQKTDSSKDLPMRVLLGLSHAIDAVTEWLGRFASAFVVLTLAIGFLNVVARYVGRFVGLQLSSNLWLELQWYLNSLTFFLMFPYVLKHNVNVRVDFLYARWSPRRKATVDLMGTLLFLIPFCVLGLWVTWNPVMMSWGRLPDGSFGTWELSPEPSGLPRAPIKSWILVAFTMLLFQALSEIIKYIAVLRGERATPPLPEPEKL